MWTKQDSNLHGHGFNVMLYHWSYSSIAERKRFELLRLLHPDRFQDGTLDQPDSLLLCEWQYSKLLSPKATILQTATTLLLRRTHKWLKLYFNRYLIRCCLPGKTNNWLVVHDAIGGQAFDQVIRPTVLTLRMQHLAPVGP